MKILLCSVPNGSLELTLKPLFPRGNDWQMPIEPVGILQINAWMKKKDYDGDIYDINSLRPSDEELIKNIKQVEPTVVVLSTTLFWCYPNVKRISKILRKLFPDIWIIVEGHLTASADVVLRKTETDICIIGDSEIPFLKLLDYFKLHPARSQIDYTELCQIRGLAFIDENYKLKPTGYTEQLPSTDMPYPDYDKLRLGLQKFGGNGELIHEFFAPINNLSLLEDTFLSSQLYPAELKFYEQNKNKKIAEIFLSRGCVHRDPLNIVKSHLQVSQKGFRAYAANDLESHIIKLKEKYNVRGIFFYDENCLSNRVQSYEMARMLKKHDIFWSPTNVRATSVTYEDLKFYKKHNMISIRFAIYSGSQKILDIMEAELTTEDIYNAISNCKKLGIGTHSDMLTIGMPGETRETVIQSAQFLTSLRYLLGKDRNLGNPYLPVAIPKTLLYEYCQQIGVIGKTLDEEEDYLTHISKHTNTNILNYVNKTNSNIKEVHYWLYLYHYAGQKAYLDLIIKNNKSIKNRLLQIYETCIKGALNNLIWQYNHRKKAYKNEKLLQKTRWLILLSIRFLLSLSVTFIPKAVLFSIIRVYANLRFYSLKKKNKVKI